MVRNFLVKFQLGVLHNGQRERSFRNLNARFADRPWSPFGARPGDKLVSCDAEPDIEEHQFRYQPGASLKFQVLDKDTASDGRIVLPAIF